MKLFSIGVLLLAFTFVQAQNKNVKNETTTTTTTIKTSEGEKKIIKEENSKEVQMIEVGDKKDNTVNRDVKNTPNIVTASTEVYATSKQNMKDKDRSSFYMINGKKYRVFAEPKGYSVVSEKNKNYARIRQTSSNIYIFTRKNKTAIATFDTNGNLMLESYNPKTDTVTFETYTVLKD